MIINEETKEAGYEGIFLRMVSLIKIGAHTIFSMVYFSLLRSLPLGRISIVIYINI